MTIAIPRRIIAAVLTLLVSVQSLEAQQQSSVRVPRSVLERYVGEWVYPEGNSIRVLLQGDTLYQETAGRRTPYTPLSDTLFMFGPFFTAEFLIDRAGGATQVLSNGTSLEYRLRRKGSPPAAVASGSALPTTPVPVSTEVLDRYVGTYAFVPGQMSRT